MTNELEKQFFDTFGIEPKLVISLEDWERCKDLPRAEELFKYYPQITDRILLELICIINQMDLYFYDELYYFTAFNYKDLKEEVISKCKRLADKNALSEVTGEHIKHQVRILFDERYNDR